jgi:hypothetical protein
MSREQRAESREQRAKKRFGCRAILLWFDFGVNYYLLAGNIILV